MGDAHLPSVDRKDLCGLFLGHGFEATP